MGAILALIMVVTMTLTGCLPDLTASTDLVEDNENTVVLRGGNIRRVHVDGVDCVVGLGSYDTTVAVSCDWQNAKPQALTNEKR